MFMFIIKVKCSLISFLLSSIEEQQWAEDYGQHNPALAKSYPVAAENPPQLLPDQPSYCEGMFSQIKFLYYILFYRLGETVSN